MISWLEDKNIIVERHGGAKLLVHGIWEAEQGNRAREELLPDAGVPMGPL